MQKVSTRSRFKRFRKTNTNHASKKILTSSPEADAVLGKVGKGDSSRQVGKDLEVTEAAARRRSTEEIAIKLTKGRGL